jgi:hypothetical protein
MAKIDVVGVPVDEEVVFIISLLIFLMLTAQYFVNENFDLKYTSGVGAFLSALSIYVFYKLHLIEEKLGYLHTKVNTPVVMPEAEKPRKRR